MTFATEAAVRLELNLYDEENAPSERITESLAQAHAEILAGTVLTDESPVSAMIRSAEVRLAVSHLFRSIVVSSSLSARDWRSTGLHIDEYGRLRNLMSHSEELWEEAWNLLRPFLRNPVSMTLIVTGGAQS